MKPVVTTACTAFSTAFSALGRAVWDETESAMCFPRFSETSFSALGRAVWDETRGCQRRGAYRWSFSALGRAVWDETPDSVELADRALIFQCSRSSRMG